LRNGAQTQVRHSTEKPLKTEVEEELTLAFGRRINSKTSQIPQISRGFGEKKNR